MTGVALQAAAWAALYASAVVLFRPYHPTTLVAVSATFVLVGGFAVAAYLNLWFLAGIRRRSGVAAYLATLLAVEAVLTVAVVLAIQGVYAVFWHPDPRRFGFGFNFASDFLGMNLVVAGASAVARIFGRRRPTPV